MHIKTCGLTNSLECCTNGGCNREAPPSLVSNTLENENSTRECKEDCEEDISAEIWCIAVLESISGWSMKKPLVDLQIDRSALQVDLVQVILPVELSRLLRYDAISRVKSMV